ncbi:MAG TPA: ROK family transcriptional regulator [Nocardioidaceae bacterium]|nr:ROK family transcriptional regulator [Nocardioidaceae bacterium]
MTLRHEAPTSPRRRDGRARLLDELASRGTASRAELARATGLAPSTVTSLVATLVDEGVVRPVDSVGRAGVGRPGQRLTLGRRAGVVVGVDLGRRHLKVAVADLSHSLLARREVAKPVDQDATVDIELIRRELEAALETAGVTRGEVLALGVGLPGPVHSTGELGDSTILPGWVGVPAAGALQEVLGLPVNVDNDANLGALSESKWGAGVGVRDLVYLKASTGIGAGLVIDGRLFRGAGHTAGEIGHTVLDPGGPVCRCGNRGCLEMYAGSAAILSALQPTHPDVTDLARAVQSAKDGDAGCRRVIADAGRAIGTALATLCNIVNPAQVIVGGTLGEAGELLLEPMRAALRRGAVRSAAEDVRIVRASLGHDAELMGAVALALERADIRV